MAVTIATAAEQAWHARYSLAVRRYLDEHPAPGLDDVACPACAAPAGRRCGWHAGQKPRPGTPRCPARLVAYAEAVDARRAAAQQAGHTAANAPQTPEQPARPPLPAHGRTRP